MQINVEPCFLRMAIIFAGLCGRLRKWQVDAQLPTSAAVCNCILLDSLVVLSQWQRPTTLTRREGDPRKGKISPLNGSPFPWWNEQCRPRRSMFNRSGLSDYDRPSIETRRAPAITGQVSLYTTLTLKLHEFSFPHLLVMLPLSNSHLQVITVSTTTTVLPQLKHI